MQKFTVYVEFYGKKLKTTVEASNEFRAEMQVRQKLHFVKIIKEEEKKPDDVPDIFKDIFGGLFK